MPGVITDLIDRVSDSNTGRPIIANLAAPGKAIGAASINIDAATNWTTSSAIHFSIYETTTVGSTVIKNASTQTDWKGTLSGVAVGNLTLTGGTDRAYTAGAKVEITPTARYAKDLYDWAMTGHNQNGTHKAFTESAIVPTAAIQDSAVTTVKVADASITNAKLSTTAGELGGAWVTYTPTFTNFTLGNGTINYSKYTKIGKTVHYRGKVTLGSTSSMAGALRITFPVSSAADYVIADAIGTGFALDAGTAEFHLIAKWVTATTFTLTTLATKAGTNPVYLDAAITSYNLAASNPMTWSTGDTFQWSLTFEAA